MSNKQAKADREAGVDIHNLIVCDSGWDSVISKQVHIIKKQSPILFERDVQTHRPLAEAEKLLLLRSMQEKAPKDTVVTMVAHAGECEFTFLVTVH